MDLKVPLENLNFNKYSQIEFILTNKRYKFHLGTYCMLILEIDEFVILAILSLFAKLIKLPLSKCPNEWHSIVDFSSKENFTNSSIAMATGEI